MSDLKHQTIEQLKVSRAECEKYISNLKDCVKLSNVTPENTKWKFKE